MGNFDGGVTLHGLLFFVITAACPRFGSRQYALRVLESIGLRDLFEVVFAVADVLPVAQAEPAGQSAQSLGPVAPTVLRYLPAGQSKAVLAPSAQ